MKSVYKRILFASPVIIGWSLYFIISHYIDLIWYWAAILIILPFPISNLGLIIAAAIKYKEIVPFDALDGGVNGPHEKHLSILREDD